MNEIRRWIKLCEGVDSSSYLVYPEPVTGNLLEARSPAREFGIRLGRDYTNTYNKEAGIYLYDYLDDDNGSALRYRLMVDKTFLTYLHEVMPRINAQGWFLTVETKRSRNRWQLVFEPKLTKRVPRGIFYHVTPEPNLDSILEAGLMPRSSRHGFKWPQNRIYLFRDENAAKRMIETLSNKDINEVEYALIAVDLRKAVNVKLYIDPELSSIAVYTTDHIEARYIKVLR